MFKLLSKIHSTAKIALFSCCLFSSLQGELVDIQKYNDKIEVNLHYGDDGNFLGYQFYPCRHVFVDGFVAARLTRVQKELAKEGIGLIVYEGYRPASVQRKIDDARQEHKWTMYFDERPHYRKGLGVDIGIYYLDGQNLALPTPWGIDCAEAYQDFPFHDAIIYHNKALLENVMIRNGFEPLRERWWHFDMKGYEMSPDLDTETDELYPCSISKVF